MAICEKCWSEAGGDFDRYLEIIKVNGCSPEEQGGEINATVCPKCKRQTVHVYVHQCMNPECDYIK